MLINDELIQISDQYYMQRIEEELHRIFADRGWTVKGRAAEKNVGEETDK